MLMMLRLSPVWTIPTIRPQAIQPVELFDASDEERRSKIAKLKQAVADGTYHVTAEELADKLIQHMLEPKG